MLCANLRPLRIFCGEYHLKHVPEGNSSVLIAEDLTKSVIPAVKERDTSGVPTAYGGYQRQYLDAVHVPPIILATTTVENHHLEGNGYQTTKTSLQNTTF